MTRSCPGGSTAGRAVGEDVTQVGAGAKGTGRGGGGDGETPSRVSEENILGPFLTHTSTGMVLLIGPIRNRKVYGLEGETA